MFMIYMMFMMIMIIAMMMTMMMILRMFMITLFFIGRCYCVSSGTDLAVVYLCRDIFISCRCILNRTTRYEYAATRYENISTNIDNCKVFRQKRLYRKKHNYLKNELERFCSCWMIIRTSCNSWTASRRPTRSTSSSSAGELCVWR